ncbi:MAG: retroviral-like aspartic protease family protein, partial [Schleiferiaceae bacterium]|nr:retroviral-like aspartic protease family protein [Schleiferiaceae bacterium]
MKTFKIAIQVLVVFVITSCTSISKLYNSGSVPQEEFSGRIAFETMFDLIILPVEIEGKQYRFLFDTGAPMVISKELREQLELKAAAKSGVTDSQGKTERLDYVWLKEVKLAGIEFKKTGAIVADLRKAPEIACMDIDGILGANLMKLAHWKIDSKNNAMYFASRKDQLEIPDSEPLVLPFKMKRTYTPVVDLVVDDSVEVNNATFDTGFAGYLSLGFG